MSPFSLRSLLLAAIVLSNCISWTASRHHYTHNVSGHRSRHRRQGAGLFLSSSYVLPGGEGTGWGEWGEVSPCSRTCGGGVASQKRICLQFGPDGSPQCTGGDTKYFSCETQDCPAGSRDFREQQCSEFDDALFREVKYRWVPYKQAPNPCELNCMPHGERFYYRHRPKVVDGTRCNDESFDVCVNGTCQAVGCDMMLGSNAREDKCRECRGSGVNCVTVSGRLDALDNTRGYSDLLLIPEGATNVVIEEIQPSRNYLALRAQNNTFYLNGNYQIDFPRSLMIAGSLWYYERNQNGLAAPDKLRCLGPTNEPLYLAILLQEENVGIDYEYSVPHDRAPPKNKEYNWAHEEYSACSAPCGGGYQTRNVTCRSRDDLDLVDEALCDKELMPATNQSCNTDACAAQWTPEPWSDCSKRCGSGGTRSREVHCTQVISNGFQSIVGDKSCFDILGPKPPLHETCNENATCPIWFTGPWKPCDKLCDEGKQTRKVLCYHKEGNRKEILNDEECVDEKPSTEQTCILRPCDGVDWVLSEWTGCDSCLSTVRTRTALCATKDKKVVNDSFCAYHGKPTLQEACDKTKLPPCDVQWYATQWSNCSVECGKGVQTRKVFCGLFDGASVLKVDDARCSKLPKYNDSKECEVPEDKCPAQWFAGPWTACSKTCGGGDQYRRVMCLRGGAISVDCNEDILVSAQQTCNTLSCDDGSKTTDTLDDDYDDDCEDEEGEEEVGLESDSSSTLDLMYSDSTTVSDDLGLWSSSTAEHESTFDTDSTLSADELLTTGTDGGSTDLTDESGSGETTTDVAFTDDSTTTELLDTGSTSNGTDSTATESTESTETEPTDAEFTGSTVSANLKKLQQLVVEEKKDSEESHFDSSEDDDDDDDDDYDDDGDGGDDDDDIDDLYPGSTEYDDTADTESTEAESPSTRVSGETSDTEPTASEGSTLTSESGPTVASESTTASGLSSSTEAGGTTESGATIKAAETSDTGSTSATESGATDASSVGSSSLTDGTTESGASSKTSETTESGSTSATESGATDASSVGSSSLTDETTESGATSKTAETSESGSTSVTESGATDATSVGSSSSTDGTPESASKETGTTETEETGTTESTVTESTETTETSETSSTESTVSESDSTESTGTSESDKTETTNVDISSTTESTETSTTETGSTKSTETSESSKTESSETTEVSTTEASETTVSSSTDSSGTTVAGSTESADTTVDGSTTLAESTKIGTTESSETTEAGSTAATESTEAGSTAATESTEAGSTAATETTEVKSTDATETTKAGTTEAIETTETRSTEATSEVGSTDATATSEAGTTEVTTTIDTGSTDSTETTESGTTESSGTTEIGTTESAETTESEATASTETTDTGITESTEATESTTEFTGSTESTESGSSKITESYTGSTESTVAEGSGSTVSTKESELSTTEASRGFTRWDLSSTVEVFTTPKKVCKRRSCARSEFGCCPDKKTPALGPFDDGCLKPKTCKEAPHGCCPDGVSPAQGPLAEGCPLEPCAETFYGCCNSDNKTAAEGNDQEGCPPPPPACLASKYGCCKDETEAKGPKKEGCPETSTTVLLSSTTEEGTEETIDNTTEENIDTSSTTEIITNCADSLYGCCFDNETAATGPELQGCPCDSSTFGCCPDGVAAAQGPNMEGCVKSCNTSDYGCCPDGKSPAHGPEYEGCCLIYPYGCCPDNFKPADGPHLEGCGCQHARFGCCPDNVTVATGPNNKGCGCQYSEHGCCPDRHTEATGPELEGCLCHTYQFGCCPDGVTIAEGPNGQGCYCQQSKYGCCGDDQTHAKGPNRQGCDCGNSKHGCCLDGVAEATGPKFEGCTDKPLDRQAACSLKFERGPCRNYSVGWFYDTEYGGCSRFWYGGCEGNGNRFSTKEECEDTCVSPPPKDACKLPKIKGACLAYNQRWYYDTEREMCSNFIYGGCLGNANNFESRELCQAQCEPERTIDQCSLTIERGSCAGNYLRWGYNKETHNCEQFIWGGCEGNTNRFSSEAACMLRCNPPGKQQAECSEVQDVGNCTDIEARWSFSQTENRCVPFYYTGCGGTGNKYTTREKCEQACPSAFVPELCTLPASTGDCYEYREKWYFDTKNQRCGLFYYGGCGGNENRFDSEQECVNRCVPPLTTPAPKPPTTAPETGSEFCFLEIDAGPCNEMSTKWGYDYTRGKCVSFQYGGCGGNRNNFPTEDHCAYYCKPTQDICQLPMLSGPCDESVMRWFYDAASDSCSQFTYGGCDGNDNRFETREDCENRCKSGGSTTTTTTTAKVEDLFPSECVTSVALEQCSRETVGEVWFYEQASGLCKPHENMESGTECRTTGVFYSQEACERSCGVFRNINVCQYAMDPGPCREFRAKYYYNANASRCEEFAYGGCFGGANRFSTEQECEQICMTTVDPCSLPAETGNCLGHMEMWYYNPGNDQCYQFVYGGCGGNDNKFESREACEGRCRRPSPVATTTVTVAPIEPTRQPETEECRTPASLAPCGTNETVFYFDEATSRCLAADIGGCGSSLNQYRSEEECMRRCGAFRGIDVCRAGLDPGPCRAAIPKFYFDSASGSCREFTYGGCQGGANRFSTINECEEVCASAGPAPACLLPVETGTQCSEVPERRWHYDVTRANCLVFSYQGCDGNQNNFGSYEECAYLCRVPTPDANICLPYVEECRALEATCSEGLKMRATPEGCTLCECEARVNCDDQQRQCEELRCRFGVQRTPTLDGCVTCACSEDPCIRMNCSSTERCEVVPSRDPDTQEVVYTPHCESNEIVDCDVFTQECSRLQCPYGVQHTRVGHCDRCSCVQEETNCTLLRRECDVLKCHYGVNKTIGADRCERCVCLPPPCQFMRCPDGERCISAPFRDPVSQETRYSAVCKSVNKQGWCPAVDAPLDHSTESSCRQECRDDADCRGVLKCCERGCARLCLAPAPPTTPQPSTTHIPDVPRAPEANTETSESRPQVNAAEGGKATLRCYFHGNPPPKITWRFGEVTIDGDAGRYRLLSDGALEIVSLFRNDSGVYICIAQNELGSAQQQVTLTVADPEETPAAIAGSDDPVTGVLGVPLVVRCQAYGYPTPAIYWYRGNGGEMVPYSNALYEARGQDLQIRRLSIETLGVYECQAYNGLGKPATWQVTIQANRPPGESRRSPYLLDREVVVTPRVATPILPVLPTTTEKPIFVMPYNEPVHTFLPSSLSVSTGGQVSLPCEVAGYPEPEVHWTKDDLPVIANDRIRIAGSRLTIVRVEPTDGGVYGCLASNDYSSHSSATRVTVQELTIPATCIDNPTFANCALIVQSRFCVHKYYSKFCCRSCVEAGQLDPREAFMQADQSFYRK